MRPSRLIAAARGPGGRGSVAARAASREASKARGGDRRAAAAFGSGPWHRLARHAAASRQHAERLAEVRHAGDEDRMVTDEAFAAILEHLQALDRAIAELDPSYLIPAPDARALADLRAPAADYVNWAQGIRGYAHQAGLWVNHPESIAVAPGRCLLYTSDAADE